MDRRPAPPEWGPGDGGTARLVWRRWGDKLIGLSIDLEELHSASRALEAWVDKALAGNQELQSYISLLDSGEEVLRQHQQDPGPNSRSDDPNDSV